ncbi:MAG: site-specific integrase [Clostridia bacterium]|nr:site-specific integrase [Clostridia bacterium]
MPRKKATKRADGRYVSTLVVGTDANGKLERKYFYSNKSQTDANNKRDAYKAEQTAKGLLGTAPGEAKKVKLETWARKWLETKSGKVKESTFDTSYRRPTERYIIPKLGNRYIADIKPIEIDAFFTKLGENYSQTVLQKTKICLSAIYDSAIDNNICYKNPCKNVEISSKKKKGDKRTYTEEQVKDILAFADTDMYGIYIRLLLELGLRCSELCGLKWSDFDLNKRTVNIERAATDNNGLTVVDVPKSKTSIRRLPFSTALLNALKQIPDINTDKYIVESTKTPNTPVNPKNFASKRYKTFWNRYLETMSESEQKTFPLLSPHELRHTCGTLMYNRSKNIYAVSKYLGHATVDITSRLYVHNDIDTLRESLGIE